MVVSVGCVKDRLVLTAAVDCAEAVPEELTAMVFAGFVCAAMEPLEVELVDNAQVLARPPVEIIVKFPSYT